MTHLTLAGPGICQYPQIAFNLYKGNIVVWMVTVNRYYFDGELAVFAIEDGGFAQLLLANG